MNNENMNQQNNQPEKAPNDGRTFSITALVLGCCCCALPMINLVFTVILLACGITAIVLGVKGRQMSRAVKGKPSGLATAGFVLGIIGTVITGLSLLALIACVSMLDSIF